MGIAHSMDRDAVMTSHWYGTWESQCGPSEDSTLPLFGMRIGWDREEGRSLLQWWLKGTTHRQAHLLSLKQSKAPRERLEQWSVTRLTQPHQSAPQGASITVDLLAPASPASSSRSRGRRAEATTVPCLKLVTTSGVLYAGEDGPQRMGDTWVVTLMGVRFVRERMDLSLSWSPNLDALAVWSDDYSQVEIWRSMSQGSSRSSSNSTAPPWTMVQRFLIDVAQLQRYLRGQLDAPEPHPALIPPSLDDANDDDDAEGMFASRPGIVIRSSTGTTLTCPPGRRRNSVGPSPSPSPGSSPQPLRNSAKAAALPHAPRYPAAESPRGTPASNAESHIPIPRDASRIGMPPHDNFRMSSESENDDDEEDGVHRSLGRMQGGQGDHGGGDGSNNGPEATHGVHVPMDPGNPTLGGQPGAMFDGLDLRPILQWSSASVLCVQPMTLDQVRAAEDDDDGGNRQSSTADTASRAPLMDPLHTFRVLSPGLLSSYAAEVPTAVYNSAKRNRLDELLTYLSIAQSQTLLCRHDGKTALHIAANNGHVAVVKLLLQYGADASACATNGWQSLHYCARRDADPEIVQALVDHGANANFVLPDGWTALHQICRYSGNAAAATILLDEGCDPCVVLPDQWEPLQQICANSCTAETVELLLKRGASGRVNERNPRGMSPLDLAVSKCSVDTVRVLLEYGADLHATDDSGNTPLHKACALTSDVVGADVVVKLLCSYGADPNICNHDGWSSVSVCANSFRSGSGNHAMLQHLLEYGGDPNAQTLPSPGPKLSPLQAICRGGGDYAAALLLLQHGADAAFKNASFWSALHYAARNKASAATMRLLLDHGSPADEVLPDGWKPLHQVCRYYMEPFEVVKALIEYGADPLAKKPDSWTAFHHISRYSGDIDTLRLLLEHGSDSTLPKDDGWTPLHLLCTNLDKPEAVTLLLTWPLTHPGAPMPDVNACNEDGDTPLHKAAAKGTLSMVKALIRCGADPTIANNAGKTAYDVAWAEKKVDCAQELKKFRRDH